MQSSSGAHLHPEPTLILPGPRPKPHFEPHLDASPVSSHLWSPLHPSRALAGAPTARSYARPAASSLASCAGNRWAPCGRGSSTEANPLLSRYGDSHPVKWNGLSIRGSLPARGFSITGLSRIGEKQHLLTRVPVRERLGWGPGLGGGRRRQDWQARPQGHWGSGLRAGSEEAPPDFLPQGARGGMRGGSRDACTHTSAHLSAVLTHTHATLTHTLPTPTHPMLTHTCTQH